MGKDVRIAVRVTAKEKEKIEAKSVGVRAESGSA